MTGFVEIEKKYLVENAGDLAPFFASLTFISKARVLDQYVDTAAGDYYQGGIFIRIRNKRDLDIKFNPDHLGDSTATDHVSCHEYTFQEPFGSADSEKFSSLKSLIGITPPAGSKFQDFLEINSLVPLLTIDKTRTTYTKGHYTIVFDEIAELGPIVEIEYSGPQSEAGNLEQIVHEMDNMMTGLPLTPLMTGSFEMLFRRDNFDLYRRGKYLLDQDKKRG